MNEKINIITIYDSRTRACWKSKYGGDYIIMPRTVDVGLEGEFIIIY